MNDLEDIDPELMHSLTWMLNNDVTELEQPFEYELNILGSNLTQELVKDGENVVVDEINKESYISNLYITKTQKEVETQIQRFRKGFFEIVPEHLMRMFSPGEIEILISGKSEIDIEDLKKYTTYRDIARDGLLVTWFWEIIECMDQNLLANLLFFITGIC